MGSANGPTRTPSNSSYKSRQWHSHIDWSISYPSATTATISVTLYFQGTKSTWGQVGKYVSGAISIGGTQVASFAKGSQSWQFSNITSKQVLTGSKTITRTTGTQNIAVSGWVNIDKQSVYDSSAGASTASGTQAVSARTSYSVSYNGNGATSGATGNQTKWHDIALTLNSNGFARTDYEFWHWNTANDNTGTTYNAGASYTGNSALTLYAIWNPIIYFDLNGGSAGPASQIKTNGQSIALIQTIPSRQGYEFAEWNTEPDGSGTSYAPGGVFELDNPTILYAQWKSNVPIKVKVDDKWLSGRAYIKINGIWASAKNIYLKIGNKWKQTIIQKTNENLLLGTKMDDRSTFVSSSDTDFSKPLRWYNGSATNHNFQLIEDDVYKDAVTLNAAANLGIAFARLASDINLDPNEYYTLSCYASCSKADAHLDIGLSYYNTADTWIWRGGSNPQYFRSVNTVQPFAFTFKPDADTKAIMYCFTVVGANGGTDTFTIYNCKLEKGVSATDWVPAAEEL